MTPMLPGVKGRAGWKYSRSIGVPEIEQEDGTFAPAEGLLGDSTAFKIARGAQREIVVIAGVVLRAAEYGDRRAIYIVREQMLNAQARIRRRMMREKG